MTDEKPDERARRPRPASSDGAPPATDAGGLEDPDAALRRLESMGSANAPTGAADAPPLPPTPAVDSFSTPPPSRPQRPAGGSQRTPRSRPAAAPSTSRLVARIAAPVVFLVAVIALIGIVVQSGVMSSDEPTTTPTPTVKATKANGGSTKVTKKYVVKSGDSLSSIAVRFNTTTSQLQVLNPDLGNTLVVGTKIVVPNQ